jgi:hypothetical protein
MFMMALRDGHDLISVYGSDFARRGELWLHDLFTLDIVS